MKPSSAITRAALAATALILTGLTVDKVSAQPTNPAQILQSVQLPQSAVNPAQITPSPWQGEGRGGVSAPSSTPKIGGWGPVMPTTHLFAAFYQQDGRGNMEFVDTQGHVIGHTAIKNGMEVPVWTDGTNKTINERSSGPYSTTFVIPGK